MPRALARLRDVFAGDFLRHGAVVFVASMTVNVLGYAFHFAISRKLGVDRYGVLSALNAGFMLSIVVPQIVSTIVVKYAAAYHASDDAGRFARLTRKLISYAVIGSVGALCVLLALVPAIASFLRIDDRAAVATAVTMIALSMGVGSLRGVLLGAHDFNFFAFSTVSESLIKMLVGIGLVYAGYGLIGAFGGWAAGSLISFALTAIVLDRRARRTPAVSLDLHVGRLVHTMSGVIAATALLAAISNADLIVVKHFADARTAGLYGALSLAGKILLFLVSFVPLIVLPKATRSALSGASSIAVLLQALAVSAALSIPGLIVYFVAPTFVVTSLAGRAFSDAAPYVFAYGVAMVELAVLSVVVAYKIGIHRFDFVVPLSACAVAEIFGIAVFHRTLADVVAVLIVGNFLAASVASWRIAAPLSAATVQRFDATIVEGMRAS